MKDFIFWVDPPNRASAKFCVMQEREKQHRSSAVLLQQWRCKCFLVQGAHCLYSTRWKENVTRGHSRSFSSIIAVSCQCTMLTNFLRTLLLLGTWLFPWCNSWKPRQSWETTVVMSFILLSISYCLCHNLFYFPWSVSLWMCFIASLSPPSCSSCMGMEKLIKYFHLVTLYSWNWLLHGWSCTQWSFPSSHNCGNLSPQLI